MIFFLSKSYTQKDAKNSNILKSKEHFLVTIILSFVGFSQLVSAMWRTLTLVLGTVATQNVYRFIWFGLKTDKTTKM